MLPNHHSEPLPNSLSELFRTLFRTVPRTYQYTTYTGRGSTRPPRPYDRYEAGLRVSDTIAQPDPTGPLLAQARASQRNRTQRVSRAGAISLAHTRHHAHRTSGTASGRPTCRDCATSLYHGNALRLAAGQAARDGGGHGTRRAAGSHGARDRSPFCTALCSWVGDAKSCHCRELAKRTS